jgi:DNA-binding CsgD family transcriptional regulator
VKPIPDLISVLRTSLGSNEIRTVKVPGSPDLVETLRVAQWFKAESGDGGGLLIALAVVNGDEVKVRDTEDGRDARGPGFGLTQREVQVAELLARGLTTRAISDQLGVAPPTVNAHVRNAKEKTACRTRAALVALVLAEGLIKS